MTPARLHPDVKADTVEAVCSMKLSAMQRAGACAQGYRKDARKLEEKCRATLRGSSWRLPEAIDCAVMADACWSLCGFWFVVWLTRWANE